MAHSRFNRLVGVLVAGSMLIGSTPGVASLPAPPPVSAWATLAGLTGGAPAAALCGAAVTAAVAQGAPNCVLPVTDVAPVAQAGPPPPVPVPPVEAAGGGLGIDPLLLALGAVAAGVGIYFLVRNKHHANSPG
jgi:hypothetical protein